MRKLVRDLRRVPVAIGDGVKRPLPSEEKPLAEDGQEARRRASARRRGTSSGEGDLVARSPADEGLPPYLLDDLLGRPLVRALEEDETILAADVARTGSTAATR